MKGCKNTLIALGIAVSVFACVLGSEYIVDKARAGYLAADGAKEYIARVMNGSGAPRVIFQDGRPLKPSEKPDYSGDVKEAYVRDGKKYFVNYPDGYMLALPANAEFDFTLSPLVTKVRFGGVRMVISKENNPYKDGFKYINEYPNRFMTAPKYLIENNITLYKNAVETIGKNKTLLIAFTRNPAPGSPVKNNTYAFAYILGENGVFYRLMFNAEGYDDSFISSVYDIVSSFDGNVPCVGKAVYSIRPKLKAPGFWSGETAALYRRICKLNRAVFGVYRPRAIMNDKLYKVDLMQDKLDYNFGVVMDYMSYKDDFPISGMRHAYEDGKIVELTVQTGTNDIGLNGLNENFSIYDGVRDQYIRKLARGAKEFGRPFLMRLNNEMNSDWTCYGGPALLNDPEIYKAIWRKFYEIFKEEGVNNAIWIFNPNDRNFPPCNYNHFLEYYPGDDYVQMLGITGYNTGTYYSGLYQEQWRSFKEIYDGIYAHYSPFFKDFPWIITEFASSSQGGDKPAWIKEMFEHMSDYPNIKLAVWFSSGDMEFDQDRQNLVARPYFLDETPGCIKAFRDYSKKYGYKREDIDLAKN